MTTILKATGSETGVQTAARSFSWLGANEQYLNEFGKVHVYDTKFGRGVQVSSKFTNTMKLADGYRSADLGVWKLSLDAKNVVVTDKRVAMLAEDGSITFEIIRDIEYAKALLADLGKRYEASQKVDDKQLKKGVFFYNSGENKKRLLGGSELLLELRHFVPSFTAANDVMDKYIAKGGIFSGMMKMSQALTAPMTNNLMTNVKVQLGLSPKEGDAQSKIAEMLRLLGTQDQAMINYSADTERLKGDFLRK